MGGTAERGANLTERQKKWFASVKASLERETGKTLEEWAAIARTCPETAPRARSRWLKETYGLGQNRAAQVLDAAFSNGMGWDEPAKLRAALWTDPGSTAILEALERAAAALPDVVASQRKAFSAFSRRVQFAAVRPVKGGTAVLGLALEPETSPRLGAPKNEPWSERLKSRVALASPAEVDQEIEALLRRAWDRS